MEVVRGIVFSADSYATVRLSSPDSKVEKKRERKKILGESQILLFNFAERN